MADGTGDVQSLVLATLRIKGRATAAAIAAAVVAGDEQVDAVVRQLVDDGLAEAAPTGFRLTPAGRAAAARNLERDRATIDGDRLHELYESFGDVNDDFKAIVTSWQLIADTQLNDHSDEAYDRGVLARLRALHDAFLPILRDITTLAPDLTRYAQRLGTAIDAIEAGQHDHVASPAIDSYHTVWFELHEELIQLAGRTRAAEAAAGRG